MNAPTAPSRLNRLALTMGPLAIVVLFLWMAGWTGTDASHGNIENPGVALDAIHVLLTGAPWALAWLAAAIGLGWPLRRWLARDAHDALAIQVGLGVAAMLFLDHALGALGWLQSGGGVLAWALIAGGALSVALQMRRWIRNEAALRPPAWIIWLASPALATLLLAACSAPGWLWATEFGGYDALSYHLQTPKEWLALGRIQPLEHNVYSFLPSYAEAAYYHLAIVRRGAIDFAYSCQLLHAGLTILTAFTVARLAATLIGARTGLIAGILFLGTPWTIVVGSLAYNEMFVLLMLSAGWISIREQRLTWRQRGIIAGICAGAACGAKLTATGMVVLPLALVLLMTSKPNRWFISLATVAFTALLALSPYFIRNAIYAHNPVFPFATVVFGMGHWSVEQADTWQRGHFSDAGIPERVGALWNEVLRFGLGSSPSYTEPWKPQWSILPWLALAGIAFGMISPRFRTAMMQIGIVALVQALFWILVTHLKSRFLLPAAAPMALAATLALNWMQELLSSKLNRIFVQITLVIVLLAWCCVPMWIYSTEANSAPALGVGRIAELTGDSLSPEARQSLGAQMFPAIALNYLLSHKSKVLALGYATPLYVHGDLIYQTTWDRGIFSYVMRQFPNDSAKWADALRQAGITHLLIDETMLHIWDYARWNDPLLTPQTVVSFAHQYAQPVYRYPNGVSLHQLRGLNDDWITEKRP